jgi:flagellar basal body-associated protein FliL
MAKQPTAAKKETAAPGDAALAAVAEATPERKPAFFGKIGIFLFVAVVIAAECGVAYLYLPSVENAAAMAGAALGEKPKPAAPAEPDPQKEKEAEAAEEMEVDLGQFSVTAFQPASNNTLRIDFHLYGTLNPKVEKEFLRLKEENLHRFRDQVIVTVRSAEIADLTDAGLSAIKRKILEKTNRLLGKSLLRSVIFSDFSSIEQ